MEIGREFTERSVRYLTGDYFPKIRRAVAELSEEDLWWRPNPASNSVGNLILHLAGNVRQWVVSGIGGAQDIRLREDEFRRAGGLSGDDLVALLEGVLDEAEAVLARLEPNELLETRVIQGMEVTVLGALYHVVEHLSTHTGQILYISKLRTGRDLGFWEVRDGKAIPRW